MTTPSTYKLGYPDLVYSTVPSIVFTRAPTTADVYHPTAGGIYPFSTIWVVRGTADAYILTGISAGSATWTPLTDSASGSVDGPASATDNALARFDTTTGKLIQNSIGILSDLGILTGVRPTLPAGTAVAATAPLKFTAGVNLTTPEAGAVEYDGTHLFFTDGAATRNTITSGPTVSTLNAIATYDGATGRLQNSNTTLHPTTGLMAMPAGAKIGVGLAATSSITIQAGTATAGTAPLKLTLGVNLATPEAGAIEYDGTLLTYTDNAAARKTLLVSPGTTVDNRLVKFDGTAGAIQQNNATTLSDLDVMTFPANGGTVLTAGTRKGTSVFGAGGISAAILTADVAADSVIVITRTNLAGAAAALGHYVTITPATSFVVTSGDAADTSAFTWAIVG